MIEHCEREQLVHAKAGEVTSGPMEGFDRNLVAVLKHLLFSRPLSPVVLLLGGLIIFSPLIEGGTTQLPVLIMRLTLLGSLMVWVTYRMKLDAIVLIRSRLTSVLLLFLGWAGLSLLWAPYKNPSVQWFISLLMYAVLFGIVIQGIRAKRQVRQVAIVMVGMGLCEGVLGIVQYVWLGEARAKGTFFNPNFFATYEVVSLSIALALLSSV